MESHFFGRLLVCNAASATSMAHGYSALSGPLRSHTQRQATVACYQSQLVDIMRHAMQHALTLLASRVMAFTTNLSVCSSEMTTEVDCLLVACATAMIGLPTAICHGSAAT